MKIFLAHIRMIVGKEGIEMNASWVGLEETNEDKKGVRRKKRRENGGLPT